MYNKEQFFQDDAKSRKMSPRQIFHISLNLFYIFAARNKGTIKTSDPAHWVRDYYAHDQYNENGNPELVSRASLQSCEKARAYYDA